jgi:hypothetical protein
MSDWVEVLRRHCAASSGNRVAALLGVSAAQVSQVLAGKYPGNTANLEARVRGEFMGELVDCPVLGDLSRADCQRHQAAPFLATNPLRIALHRACPGCPNRSSK